MRRLFNSVNSGSAKAMSIQLRPKPEHAKSDGGYFLVLVFLFPRSYGSSAPESQQKADSRQTRCLGGRALAPSLHEPSAHFDFEAQLSLAYGGAASEPSSKPGSLLEDLPVVCNPAAPLQCSALHCKSQLRSAAPLDFLQPAFHSPQPRHLPFSLAHTHTNAHTQTPCTDASSCLPANLPAPARPLLPRSETALQRARPVLCLCLCRCLGRPSAAPPVFGRSPSCIAIAENILSTSTRRRLNPAQAKPRQALQPLPTVYIRSLRSSSSLVTPSFCLLVSFLLSISLSVSLPVFLCLSRRAPRNHTSSAPPSSFASSRVLLTTQTTTPSRALHHSSQPSANLTATTLAPIPPLPRCCSRQAKLPSVPQAPGSIGTPDTARLLRSDLPLGRHRL